MALTPEERARIAEEERVRHQTQMQTGLGYLKKFFGCMAIILLLAVATCTVMLRH